MAAKAMTLQEFVSRAITKHGADAYDYSEVVMRGTKKSIFITCNKCGERFESTPARHLRGCGCSHCARINRQIPFEEFVAMAKAKHGDKYSYPQPKKWNGIKTVIDIICPKHGAFPQKAEDHIKGHNCPDCAYEQKFSLICGVGINDYKGSVFINGKTIPSYQTWKHMLERCYMEVPRVGRKNTYADCSVCDEWLRFSNFKKWYDENYRDGYQIDKDILIQGNRIYSPETCCFVPNEINAVTKGQYIKEDGRIKGLYVENGKYCPRISRYGDEQRLGVFTDLDEAKAVLKREKEKYIKELANKYYSEGKITEKVYNALLLYEIIT